MRAVTILCFIAACLWLVMFLPVTAAAIPFWPAMSISVAILIPSALILNRRQFAEIFNFKLSHLLTGAIAAVLLYLVFFFGREISYYIFPFARDQVGEIYSRKDQANTILIGLLLAFWIGPGEEIFWRGFVQQRMAKRFGHFKAFLLASAIYTAVHIPSLNLLLIGAAFVCGLFWGYMFYRYKSIWPGLISHAIWDVVIFIILPL